MKSLPSPQIVREVLAYNPDTGMLLWLLREPKHFTDGRVQSAEHKALAWNMKWAGTEAFTADDGNGYRVGNLFSRLVPAHRVAWAYVYGEWPAGQIDHINGNPADNRIANLRVVNDAENRKNQRLRKNNTIGVHGISQRASGRWAAEIKSGRVRRYLGTFDTLEQAVAARKAAERELGFHPNHGRGR